MTRLLLLIGLMFAAFPTAAQQRTVAVTFDDLPFQASTEALCDPETALRLTSEFLAMLAPLDSRGTAFVNEGKGCDATRAQLMPTILDAWLEAGLDLGNHTASHINIHRNTVEAYLADVDAGAPYTRVALEARGRRLHWFRHPYLWTGETPGKKAAIAEGLAARGYDVAPVTIDNNDWMFAGAYRRAEAVGDAALMSRIGEAYVAHMAAVLDHMEPYSAELTGGREPAQILLLHANSLNRDWYPKIHALYLSRGYRFVTLDEAMADPVYSQADDYVRANGISWVHRWMITEGRTPRREPDPPQWVADLNNAR